ncbi:hypothetical protein HG263_08100 [Pseudoalteromonas sp. JBTF-M23]|uniref:Uncharacterized protein n=1 Tax=Pseudoalteromonas caenipelagi TaxID=2726988 RepID=A0A849VFL4_9GAMM|nr:hypothetical protein [Pseudoalteromonas caenipelagi]NOU50501.1 hypothetical protein [Pseudoalteromonas caenipelagi]
MKKYLVLMFLSLLGSYANADYNANITGKVTSIATYTYSGRIYFRLDNQPSSHPACQTDYFAIDESTPDAIRQQVYSRLLVAYSSGKAINIGYDKEGGCAHGRIKVYRVG